MVVVDSSIFVSAFYGKEYASKEAFELVSKLQTGTISVVIPASVIFETVGALSRRTNDIELAKKIGRELLSMEALSIIDVTSFRVLQNLDFTAESRLAGMDAIVVSTALEFNLPLVTLDKEMADRAKKFVKVLSINNL